MVRRSAVFALALLSGLVACSASSVTQDPVVGVEAPPAGGDDAGPGGGDPARDAASDGPHADADAAPSCSGIDLEKDPKNCGVCGHDCGGGACAYHTCSSITLGPFPGEPYGRAVARGVVGGKLVWVVTDGPALKVVAVDPSAPGFPAVTVASGLAPLVGGDERLAAVTDDAVFVIHQVPRSKDPAPCAVVQKATHTMCVHVQRIGLADGSIDTWTSFTWPNTWFARGAAAFGDRLLVNEGSLVVEITKSAGHTGRYVFVVQPSTGLAMNAESAWVAAGKIVRIDLATFKATSPLASSGFGGILGMVGSTVFATLTDTNEVKLVSLDTANAAASPVELARRPYKGQFSVGVASSTHVLFSAEWQIPGSLTHDDVALELKTGRITPRGTLGETAILHGGWAYGFVGNSLLRVAP